MTTMTPGGYGIAPEWEVERWFGSDEPLTIAGLRGKVVVALAFQMLCPGCVQTALPQLRQVHDGFDRSRVAAIGLHTVFEHHAAMTPVALEAFLHEYRLGFPVGVDQAGPAGGMPVTMARYQMQGTPTLLLIDALGRLRLQHFGHVPDLLLGAHIMRLVDEADGLGLSPAGMAGADMEQAKDAATCATDGSCG